MRELSFLRIWFVHGVKKMVNEEMAMLIGAVFLGAFSAIIAAWAFRILFVWLVRGIFFLFSKVNGLLFPGTGPSGFSKRSSNVFR